MWKLQTKQVNECLSILNVFFIEGPIKTLGSELLGRKFRQGRVSGNNNIFLLGLMIFFLVVYFFGFFKIYYYYYLLLIFI